MVTSKWESAESFYQERDHRTQLEVVGLKDYSIKPVEIHVDPSYVHDLTVQRMAIIAANLTARWARCIRIVAPDAKLASPLIRDSYQTLHERIMGEMSLADPFGSFEVIDPCDLNRLDSHGTGLFKDSLRLYIGPWEARPYNGAFSEEDYVVMAWGWISTGRRWAHAAVKPPEPVPATVSAAALTASLGAADLFKRAVNHAPDEWLPQFAWCTWRNQLHEVGIGSESFLWQSDILVPADEVDFGRMLLAGAGAIGSALVYLADLTPIRGALTLLDRDNVDTTNLNRSPLFSVLDAMEGLRKTTVVEKYLSERNISIKSMYGTWHEFADQVGSANYDLWVSLTNEDGAWAEVPFQLPPIVLHGTTTSGWGFSAGRHIPQLEDCTLCRMPRPEAEFRGPCAEGDVAPALSTVAVRASLPFLSTASAALLLGEVLKLQCREAARLPNDISVDLRFGLADVITFRRKSVSDCRGCRAISSHLWKNRRGHTRYASFSEQR